MRETRRQQFDNIQASERAFFGFGINGSDSPTPPFTFSADGRPLASLRRTSCYIGVGHAVSFSSFRSDLLCFNCGRRRYLCFCHSFAVNSAECRARSANEDDLERSTPLQSDGSRLRTEWDAQHIVLSTEKDPKIMNHSVDSSNRVSLWARNARGEQRQVPFLIFLVVFLFSRTFFLLLLTSVLEKCIRTTLFPIRVIRYPTLNIVFGASAQI